MIRVLIRFFFIYTLICSLGCNTPCRNNVYTHQQSKEYTTLYPYKNNLYYTKIDIIDTFSTGQIGFLFHLINTFENFQLYKYHQDSSNTIISHDDEFMVLFNKNVTTDKVSKVSIEINANENNKIFEMNLSYDPFIYQKQFSREILNDGLYIRKTDIRFIEIKKEDFVVENLSDGDIVFFRTLLEKDLNKVTSNKEKVNKIAANLMDMIEPHRGIPSNYMDTISVPEQVKRLLESQDRVYCGNIADIFIYACLAYDIPIRKIGLGNTYNNTSNPVLYHSDHHTTVEVYDNENKNWYLMDLSFYLFEAKLTDGTQLNIVDFYYLLNTPELCNEIIISEYNPKTRKVITQKITESGFYGKFLDYYKQNQKLIFRHKNGYYSF